MHCKGAGIAQNVLLDPETRCHCPAASLHSWEQLQSRGWEMGDPRDVVELGGSSPQIRLLGAQAGSATALWRGFRTNPVRGKLCWASVPINHFI